MQEAPRKAAPDRRPVVAGLQLAGLLIAIASLLVDQLFSSINIPQLPLHLILSVIIITEVVLDLVLAPWKISWLRGNWMQLFLAFLYLGYAAAAVFRVIPGTSLVWQLPGLAILILRNFFLYFRLFAWIRRLSSLLQSISLHPAQTLVLSFLMIIIVGAVLLMLPAATVDGKGLGFTDSLFTATSAVCVTGLIVVDTATYFTTLGQVIILLLIQAGGLGIMLLSFTASWVINRRLNLNDKLMLAYMTNEDDLSLVSRTMLSIVLLTFGIEAAGTVVLSIGFLAEGMGLGQSVWYGVFHSVSAFCNAGFALFSDSFVQYRHSIILNSGLSILIILGGISFAVIINLGTFLRRRFAPGKFHPRNRLSLNTRVVLSTSAILLVSGTLLIYFTEHGNSLADEPLGYQYLEAFFQSVTLRTAGFNTVDFAKFSSAAVFISVLYMIVGGASGSTAGGIKVNTIAVIFSYLRSRFRGQKRILMFNYALARNTASNALVLFVFAVFAVSAGFFLLLMSEKGSFSDVLFETVSAFGTVGVSRGLTPNLSVPGRFIIVVLMFMGRIGPLTLLTALADREVESDVIYPEQELMIG